MSKIRDRVKSKMGYLMLEEVSMPLGMPEKIVKKLLSIPELAVVNREAELPEIPDFGYDLGNCRRAIKDEPIEAIYTKAQQDMLKEGWVKEVEE